MLSRDQILAAQDRPHEDVEIPEWGGTVRVRAMGCAEKDFVDGAIVRKAADGTVAQDMSRWRALMVAASLVGEDGRPLFTVADADALAAKSPAAADRIIEVQLRLSYPNGAQTTEDAVKN